MARAYLQPVAAAPCHGATPVLMMEKAGLQGARMRPGQKISQAPPCAAWQVLALNPGALCLLAATKSASQWTFYWQGVQIGSIPLDEQITWG